MPNNNVDQPADNNADTDDKGKQSPPDTVPYSVFSEKVKKFRDSEDGYKDQITNLSSRLSEFEKAEEERERQKALRKGEYEKIELKNQEEIASLRSEIESLKPFKERWTSYEESERKKILESFPEDIQKQFENEPLETLIKVQGVRVAGKQQPGHTRSIPNELRGFTKDDGSVDKVRLAKDRPDLYKELKKEGKL